MAKITDYKLVVEQSNTTLDRTINDLIRDGWQPNGGVAVAVTESGAPYDKDSYYHIVYAQAMVKYEVDTRYDEWLAYHSSPRIFNLTSELT